MTVEYIPINMTVHEAIAIKTKYTNREYTNKDLRKAVIQILKFGSECIGWIRKFE